MIQLEFTFEAIDALEEARFTHPHPFVRRKMEAAFLKSQDLHHQTICKLCRISPNTLRSYLSDYQLGGLEQLKEIPFYRPQSALKEHQARIQGELKLHPVATVKQARAKILELTGLERGLTQVGHWLENLGIKTAQGGDGAGQN